MKRHGSPPAQSKVPQAFNRFSCLRRGKLSALAEPDAQRRH
jgi:hypothetical protein